MNFKRIIAQIHSMWDNQIDNRYQVAIEHSDIRMEHRQPL
jgi:hypothetical protein